MAQALRLAARVDRRPWPNPPVGALVVRRGEVVGRGAHQGAGTLHAEIVALREAGERARGATLYCTLEPCNHQGRMPPCAPAVAASGIARLVIAVRDPNPLVAGGGLEVALGAGITVTLGVGADEALDMMWPFVATCAFRRPFVWLKTATSIDGRFAPAARAGRSPVYLTSDASRHEVHVLRRWSDVVLVGSRTVDADRPRLDTRLVTNEDSCPALDPSPAVATSRTELEEGRWWARPHIVFAGSRGRAQAATAAPATGATVVACEDCEDGVAPASMVAGLKALGVYTLLVEGGPRLAASFLAAGLVDRWIAYTAPMVLGSGPGWPDYSPPSEGLTLTRVTRCGSDVKAVWDRVPFEATRDRLTSESAGTHAVAAPPGVA